MTSDITQRIKDTLPIEEIVGGYVKLQRAGRVFRAPCPFHSERTPSFYVSPERSMFKCFGCGKGGDIFSFIQEMEGMTFPEALRLLAGKAGITLDKPEFNKNHSEIELIRKALDDIRQYYEVCLRSSSDVIEYLLGRGITKETLIAFHVGYAPAGTDTAYRLLQKRGHKDSSIEQSGIASRGPRGWYDRFRERIMFPICDTQGRIVGFSGRIFLQAGSTTDTSTVGKYVNSPDGPLFHKSNLLFGFDKAKRAFVTKSRAIIVEGQIDLLMAHQAGYTETVALSGTALTTEQCKMLKRFTDTLVLVLDGDPAGIAATERSVMTAIDNDLLVTVALLPLGNDPADMIASNPEGWKSALENSVEYVPFRLAHIRADSKLTSLRDTYKAIETHIFPVIARTHNILFRDAWIRECAHILGDDSGSLRLQYERWELTHSPKPSYTSAEVVAPSFPVVSPQAVTPVDLYIAFLRMHEVDRGLHEAYKHTLVALLGDHSYGYDAYMSAHKDFIDTLVLGWEGDLSPDMEKELFLNDLLMRIEYDDLINRQRTMRSRLSEIPPENLSEYVSQIDALARRIDEIHMKMRSL